ncbi:MAG TPA: tol-pal system protein YbgF [Desulfobacteraceae bacterium]|nr:tol-pal system protein YbgF [Desulfobacteraceae bacterium]
MKPSAFLLLALSLIASLGLSSCASLSPSEKQRIDHMEKSIARLDEQLTVTENRLQQTEQQVVALTRATQNNEQKINRRNQSPSSPEKTGEKRSDGSPDAQPEALYQKARSLLLEEAFHPAAELFETFAAKHPDHELADNALYWLGECHYSMNDYRGAVAIFKTLVKAYPGRGKVPDALLKTAYAYLSLDDADRAHHFLKEVVRQYPFSPAGEKAEQKLKQFQ